jgi:serine protease Do
MNDGTELDAKLIGTDPETDLAVVKVIDPGKYPYVEFEQTDKVRVGDWVVALGNPFGLGGTATAGIVSADGRDLGAGSQYTDFLQIDASINQGNSGGPTFDLQGRVIGVNTQILSPTGGSVGIGFAIPAELAVSITNELIKNGEVKRGWLGVQIGDFREEYAEALDLQDGKGALVADVTSGSPAGKAGIKRSDVIVQLNGIDIDDANDLTRLVAKLIVGSSNDFVVLRRGKRRVIKVEIGERPKNLTAGVNTPIPDDDDDADSDDGTSVLGVGLSKLDDDARKALGLDDDEKGLLVNSVSRDSPFARIVTEGFALLEVNGRPMENVDDLKTVIDSARRSGKEKVLVTVRSVRGTNFATVDISESDDE